MIGRERDGELRVECNECGNEEFGGTMEFNEFLLDLKDRGWRVVKSDEGWEHLCEECS